MFVNSELWACEFAVLQNYAGHIVLHVYSCSIVKRFPNQGFRGDGRPTCWRNAGVSVSRAHSLPFKIVEWQGVNQLYPCLNLSLLLNCVSVIWSVLFKLLKNSRELLGCLNCSIALEPLLPSTLRSSLVLRYVYPTAAHRQYFLPWSVKLSTWKLLSDLKTRIVKTQFSFLPLPNVHSLSFFSLGDLLYALPLLCWVGLAWLWLVSEPSHHSLI